jgi:lipopolysaccharide export system permease protein
MYTLERYLGRTVLLAIALSLGALLALLVFAEFVDNMSRLGKGEFRVSDAFFLALLTIPRQTFELFPFAALLGSLLGLGALASGSELVAMRAAGFSLTNMLTTIVKAIAIALVVVFALGELVAPQAEQFGNRYKAEKLNKQVTFTSKHGFWARDGEGFVNIRKILPGGHLEDIYLYEFDQDGALQLATRAQRAEYENNRWTLYEIAQSQLTSDRVVTRRLERATWASLIDPGLLDLLIQEPTMLPLTDLHQYIAFMQANGQSSTAFEVAFWNRIAMPIATIVMIFLALPVVLGNLRSTGMGQRIMVGVSVGMIFQVVSRGFSYVALAYDVLPWLMVLLPSLSVFVVGAWLMRRVA